MDSAIQEIERAIEALTPLQQEEILRWLDERHPQSIDTQLGADLEAGRLDDRIHRALTDHSAGRTRQL